MTSIHLLPLLICSAAASLCTSFTSNQCSFLFANASCLFVKCTSLLAVNSTTPPTISQNWDICTSQCCSNYNGPSSPKIIDTLGLYCSVESQKLSVGITVGVAIGFIVIVLLIVLCCMYYNFMRCICPCFAPTANNRDPIQAPSQLQLAPQMILKTEEVLVTEQLFEQRASVHVCSICLEGDTDLATKCGHHFHLQCLAEWTKQRRSCPECRTEEMSDFVIYCSKCLKNYQKTNQLPIEGNYLCKYCKL